MGCFIIVASGSEGSIVSVSPLSFFSLCQTYWISGHVSQVMVSPQPDTSLHCETTDTGLVHRAVCLHSRPSFHCAYTHGGTARLSCRVYAYMHNGVPILYGLITAVNRVW